MTWNVLLAHKGGPEREKIEKIVSTLGGTVTLVTTQSGVVSQVRDTYHDLAILDGEAVEMDLLRLLPNLRQGLSMNATTPTIALVPSPRGKPKVDYARAGYYDSFELPVEPWRLREAIYMVGLADRPMLDRHRSLAVIAALSDPTTRAVFVMLQNAGPLTSAEVGERLEMTRKGAANHTQALVNAGLSVEMMSGRKKLYVVHHTHIEGAAHWMLELASGTEQRPFRRRKPRA